MPKKQQQCRTYRHKSLKPWKIDNIDLTQQFSLSILIDFRYLSIKITWLLSIFIDTDFQGRTIRKVIRGGGGGLGRGIVKPQEFLFVIKFLVWIFFRPKHKYFLGLTGVHEFFSFNFRMREYFFCTSTPPPPPYNFSNGPSLIDWLLRGYILWLVALLEACDVTKHGHHLRFYQELEIR